LAVRTVLDGHARLLFDVAPEFEQLFLGRLSDFQPADDRDFDRGCHDQLCPWILKYTAAKGLLFERHVLQAK
jgi:hypothetical protein